jgi:mannonate dehydratase
MQSQIKLSMRIDPEPTDAELLFARQLGIEYLFTWVPDDQRDLASLLRLKEKVENTGLKLWNVGNFDVGKSDRIHLALPGRDEKIAQFADFIRNLGQAGIHYTTFTWESSGVWSSEPRESRGASARYVDLEEMAQRPLTHGRQYTLDELWANYTYFIQTILPVAEEAGVHLSLHPNDPPTDSLGGIPCLINSFERYVKAFAIADNSPYLGMEFCTGCWLEGGDQFGNMLEAIQYFTERNQIFIVHFRNVSTPFPQFTETFLDNGYMDLYQAMRAFVAAGYSGSMHLDHTPTFVGDYALGGGTAYAIGYMRALIERAEAELG